MKTYRRCEGIEARILGAACFVTPGGDGDVHELSPHAAAVWQVLAEPQTEQSIIELFATAFPYVPRRRLRGDMRRLLSEMLEAGYIAASS